MKSLALFTWLLLLTWCVSAQTTQYAHHRQLTNPSAMGEENSLSFALLGQYRLYGFENAPMQAGMQITVPFGTQTEVAPSYYSSGGYLNAGHSTDTKNMFVGLSAYGTSMGAYRTYNAMLSYAYQLSLSQSAQLALGVALGMAMDSKDYSTLVHDYDMDPLIPTSKSSHYALSSQVGAYLHGAQYYLSLYSPAIIEKDVFLQAGWHTTIGKTNDDEYEDNPEKKNKWEIHAQAGNTNGGIIVQGSTIFTLNNLLGIGIAWQNPLNLAALATLNIKSIKIGYSYQLTNLNQNLLQHEIVLKINFSPKKKEE